VLMTQTKGNRIMDKQNNEMIKIVMLGDSVGAGIIKNKTTKRYESSEKSFAKICEKTLGIVVENCSRFGSSIFKGEVLISRFLDKIQEAKSGYVLFIFGGNDCNYDWNEIAEKPYGKHLTETPIKNFRKKYTELIKKIKKMGKNPVLLSLPPIASNKFYNTITTGKNAGNILRFLKGSPYSTGAWHMMYNLEIFKLGVKNKVPVIDITSPFLTRMNYENLFCDDGMHPNESGHKLIAKAIKGYIKEKFVSIDRWKKSVLKGNPHRTFK
jgi:lysophospholipase L1-like esterase